MRRGVSVSRVRTCSLVSELLATWVVLSQVRRGWDPSLRSNRADSSRNAQRRAEAWARRGCRGRASQRWSSGPSPPARPSGGHHALTYRRKRECCALTAVSHSCARERLSAPGAWQGPCRSRSSTGACRVLCGASVARVPREPSAGYLRLRKRRLLHAPSLHRRTSDPERRPPRLGATPSARPARLQWAVLGQLDRGPLLCRRSALRRAYEAFVVAPRSAGTRSESLRA